MSDKQCIYLYTYMSQAETASHWLCVLDCKVRQHSGLNVYLLSDLRSFAFRNFMLICSSSESQVRQCCHTAAVNPACACVRVGSRLVRIDRIHFPVECYIIKGD